MKRKIEIITYFLGIWTSGYSISLEHRLDPRNKPNISLVANCYVVKRFILFIMIPQQSFVEFLQNSVHRSKNNWKQTGQSYVSRHYSGVRRTIKATQPQELALQSPEASRGTSMLQTVHYKKRCSQHSVQIIKLG